MSDIINPEPKHVEPVVPAPDILVPGPPHNGTLPTEMGGEKSVVEHPAPLRESILTAPDNPAGALDKPEKHKKGLRRLAIAGGALGLAAASLFAATRSDESSAVMTETPTTEEAVPGTSETTETTTPATETSTQNTSGETYKFLPANEQDTLSKLAAFGYPDRVKRQYSADMNDAQDTLINVASDVSAVINTHDYDAFASMLGREGADSLDDPNQTKANLNAFDAFYEPSTEDMRFIHLRECVDNGDTIICSGYVPLYAFLRNLSAAETKDYIDNPTYPNQPVTSGVVYMDINFNVNKSDNLLSGLSFDILYDEPSN